MRRLLAAASMGVLSVLAGTGTAQAGFSVYQVHTDHLDTPKAMSDESAVVVWRADHTPHGTAMESVLDEQMEVRFPGQYFDQESGLHYNYHRYYDPQGGRYLRSDPFGLAGGLNTYGYALNNPTRYIDPTGQYSTLAACWTGALVEPTPVGEVVCSCVSVAWVAYRGYRIASAVFGGCGGAGAMCADDSDDSQPRTENPAKANSPIWNGDDFHPDRNGRKNNGKKGKSRRIYEWDHLHDDIEVYDRRGRHLGSMDPTTGEMYKSPVPGRTITP